MTESNRDFITLARVVKTQGRRGEVAVEIHTDVPDRFEPGMKLFALRNVPSTRQTPGRQGGAERVVLEITDLWPHKGLLVLKFVGVDSISDAEVLVGAELQLPRAERAQLDAGWTYVSDLIGCVVFDHGKEVGRIDDVEFGAGEAPLLILAAGVGDKRGEDKKGVGKKFDVPFAEAYLESVDIARKEVRMNLPDGMLEVNAPVTAEEKEQQKR